MFIVLLVICLTGCSLFTNTDKIQDKADLAFEQKEFDQFNKFYNELKEANPEEVEEALNSSLTDINRNLITLEDVTAPDDYKDNHDMFLASLKEYSEKLENQYMFFHVKGPNLVSSNTLLREGNIFSTISINDLEEEFKQYQSELDIATNNLGQRIRTISEEIDISPIYNVPNL